LSIPIGDFKNGFETFADDVASVLPMNSTIGLNWSDAYIGQLLAVPPSFGIGITTGFTTIPYDSIKSAVQALKGDLGELPSIVKDLGLPLPAVALDARIGGFILPFDVGFKIGFIPKTLTDTIGSSVDLDYLLVGGDVRYRVLSQTMVVIPEVSIGLGYNYQRGSVAFGGVLPGSREYVLPAVTGAPWNGGDKLSLASPDFNIEWESKVIDLKAQASWSFLVVQPSVGLGASYGMSHVGGGAESKLQLNGHDITGPEAAALESLGYEADGASLSVFSDVTGWSFRLFGGMSVNILLLRLDMGLQYNLIGKNLGATIGARVQL
jgi:hypothetical protein